MASVVLGQDTSHSSFSTLRTPGNKMRELCYLQSSSNLAIDLLASSMFSMAFIPLTATVNSNPASVHLLNASRTCSRSQKNYPSTLSSMQSMSAPTRVCRHHVTESWLMERFVALKLPNLHLCVTSRPEADIRTSLEPLTSTSNAISLHDESGQKKDIVEFLTSVVRTDKNMRRWREEDKELVIKTLSERADGM
jgi:hypothetical protein